MSSSVARITDQLNEGWTSGLKYGQTEWQLLDRKGNAVLLMADNIIDHAPYERSIGEMHVDWCDSYLRKHMNRDLPMWLFTNAELENIAQIRPADSINPYFNTVCRSSGSIDRLFPLSLEEVDKYLGYGSTLSKGRLISGHLLSDAHDIRRKAKHLQNVNIDWWWLRTAGRSVEPINAFVNPPVHHQCYVAIQAR